MTNVDGRHQLRAGQRIDQIGAAGVWQPPHPLGYRVPLNTACRPSRLHRPRGQESFELARRLLPGGRRTGVPDSRLRLHTGRDTAANAHPASTRGQGLGLQAPVLRVPLTERTRGRRGGAVFRGDLFPPRVRQLGRRARHSSGSRDVLPPTRSDRASNPWRLHLRSDLHSVPVSRGPLRAATHVSTLMPQQSGNRTSRRNSAQPARLRFSAPTAPALHIFVEERGRTAVDARGHLDGCARTRSAPGRGFVPCGTPCPSERGTRKQRERRGSSVGQRSRLA